MPDTFTATYNFTKPEVGASRDVWGNKWNVNLDNLDTILVGKLSRSGGDVTGLVTYSGPNPTIGAGANNEIATRAWVLAQIAAALPNGIIAKWKGTVASIPAGWALCNGLNGTPNLVNRFIVAAGDTGAGATYAPGAMGGSNTITGFTDYHALTVGQLANHGHSISDPGHSHNAYTHNHNHDYQIFSNQGNASAREGDGGTFTYQRPGNSGNTGTTVQGNIGVTVNGAGTGINVQNTGSGEGHRHALNVDNRPLYYALCFIMKL